MRGLTTAIGIGCLATSAATAASGVPSWERRAFDRVNALPDGLAPVAWLPMQAGALAAPLVLGALQAVVGRQPGKGARTAATGAAAWGVAKALKRQIMRGRPGDHAGGATLRVGSADEGLGFPSGHAAVVVIVAMSLAAGRGMPSAGLAGALAGLVGMSRIYVGAHYPLDVVGGWGLGLLLWSLPWPDGRAAT